MKKILNITGVQQLSREQQQQIKGAWGNISCCPSGRGCRISFGNTSFCEPGYCDPYRPGRCIIY